MRKTETEDCIHCDHTGWVCEDHPDKPMLHDDCSGAGMPCAACAVPMREAA
jgi:hypothetical protein